MITPPDYTGHFGRKEMSLQGTRYSQPFGLSNKSVASAHEQCTSTRPGSTFMGGNKPMDVTILI
jgi:hypothetical protein